MEPLNPTQRRALRARAHHLQPVVIIGQHGLTPAVAREIDLALDKHELIKVRVFSDVRAEREALLVMICADMDCAGVQHLGKILVVWRPNPDLAKKPAPARREAKSATKSGAKRPKAPKTGPRAPVDPIRERRRGATADSPVGKGTRGAARFNALPEGAPLPVRRTRQTDDAIEPRRKSTYTPKSKPRSFSAKPNPREAWAKKPPAGSPKPASSPPRRRRKA